MAVEDVASDSCELQFISELKGLRALPRCLWLQVARDHQTRSWLNGIEISSQQYLALLPELCDEPEDMLVLICGEILLRRELGQAPDLARYQAAYPALADQLAVQFQLQDLVYLSSDVDEPAPIVASVSAPVVPAPPGYRWEKVIGRGAFSVVYLAWQESVGRHVAIKVMRDVGDDAVKRARQQREIKILAMLTHPHTVSIYEAIYYDERYYLVMEYVPGSTLADLLVHGPLPPRQAVEMLVPIVRALDAVHQLGVVHRDLKPSNILRTTNGELKISDFGLAAYGADNHQLSIDTLLGTPSYMAPEQIRGEDAPGPTCDIYAMGAILYELITQHAPFQGGTVLATLHRTLHEDLVPPRRIRSGIPRDLEMICLKCLAREPADRYPSAAALVDELQRFLAGQPVEARRTSVMGRWGRWSRRNRRTAIVLVCVAVTVVITAVGFLRQRHDYVVTQRSLVEESQRRRALVARVQEVEQQRERQSDQMRRRGERLQAAWKAIEQANRHRTLMYWDDAELALTQAIDAAPELPAALLERGNLYLGLHLYELAEKDYAAAWTIQPPSEFLLWNRMAVLARLHGHALPGEQSVSWTSFAAWPHIERVWLLASLPASTNDLGTYVDALEVIGRGSECPPWHWYVLALGSHRVGRQQQTLEYAARALQSDWRERGLVYPLQAIAHISLGDRESALQALALAEGERVRWVRQMTQPPNANWIVHQNVQTDWPIPPNIWLEFLVYYREARERLGMTPLDDPWMNVLRARGFAGLRHPEPALEAYRHALALAPEDPSIQLEHFRVRAFWNVTKWKFSAAADDYLSAIQIDPEDIRLWNFAAFACLTARDFTRYAETCEEMVARFEKTQSVTDAIRVSCACVTHPSALKDWSRLEQLMQRMEPLDRYLSTRYWAAVKYRAGNCADALEIFERLEKTEPISARDYCFMAMSLGRLGRPQEAKRRFEQASAWIATANAPGGDPDNHVAWGIWTDRPQTFALYLEAAAQLGLVGSVPPPRAEELDPLTP